MIICGLYVLDFRNVKKNKNKNEWIILINQNKSPCRGFGHAKNVFCCSLCEVNIDN